MKTIITSMICVSILSSCSYQQKLTRAERKIERLTNKYPELKQTVSIPVSLEYKIPEYEIEINTPLIVNESIIYFCDSLKKGKVEYRDVVKYVSAKKTIDTLDVIIDAHLNNGDLKIKVTKKEQIGVVNDNIDTTPIIINKAKKIHYVLSFLAGMLFYFFIVQKLTKSK